MDKFDQIVSENKIHADNYNNADTLKIKLKLINESEFQQKVFGYIDWFTKRFEGIKDKVRRTNNSLEEYDPFLL